MSAWDIVVENNPFYQSGRGIPIPKTTLSLSRRVPLVSYQSGNKTPFSTTMALDKRVSNANEHVPAHVEHGGKTHVIRRELF